MKRIGIPEIDDINARWDGTEDVIRVEEPPYAATMTDAERDQAEMVAQATRALSGETPVTKGEDKGWLFIGGVNFSQPLFLRDGNGVPLVKVTVEPMPSLPLDYLQRVLPALIKRDPQGGLCALLMRFNDTSLAYSNQPSAEQMMMLMGMLGKVGAMKPKDAPKPPMPATKFTGFKPKK